MCVQNVSKNQKTNPLARELESDIAAISSGEEVVWSFYPLKTFSSAYVVYRRAGPGLAD